MSCYWMNEGICDVLYFHLEANIQLLWRWWVGSSTCLVRRDWGNWACSTWRRDGTVGMGTPNISFQCQRDHERDGVRFQESVLRVGSALSRKLDYKCPGIPSSWFTLQSSHNSLYICSEYGYNSSYEISNSSNMKESNQAWIFGHDLSCPSGYERRQL